MPLVLHPVWAGLKLTRPQAQKKAFHHADEQQKEELGHGVGVV